MTNKQKIVEYLNIVFNEKNIDKAELYWDGGMTQHNPDIPDGLDVIRDFILNADINIKYEHGLAMEDGNIVMVHGRYSGWNNKSMIAVDIFRIENGKIVEHWDVMQEEVAVANSVNGHPMFPAFDSKSV